MTDTSTAPPNASRTARERARVELTGEIKTIARRHLAEHGSSSLSLRAVARDLGMVSSAVYRYFPSRDDLLTALIIDAYSALGQRVVEAEAVVRRGDLMGRWLTACRAFRAWAHESPHEYALIFGSPVPGYRAPQDTIDPAVIVPLVLIAIVADGAPSVDRAGGALPRAVRADMGAVRAQVSPDVGEHELVTGVLAWTHLVGAVSFEMFGHLHNVITDHDTYFDYSMRRVALDFGLLPDGRVNSA